MPERRFLAVPGAPVLDNAGERVGTLLNALYVDPQEGADDLQWLIVKLEDGPPVWVPATGATSRLGPPTAALHQVPFARTTIEEAPLAIDDDPPNPELAASIYTHYFPKAADYEP